MNSLIDRRIDKRIEPKPKAPEGFLFNQFLVATPAIMGGHFEKSVVLVTAHDDSGALGLIINKPVKTIKPAAFLETMGVKIPKKFKEMPVYLGGPVDTNRGFIIYSNEVEYPASVKLKCGVNVSTDRRVLQDYIDGVGPKQAILAMGYSGWLAGNVEEELLDGAWINFPANKEVIFSGNNDGKWQKTGAINGIDLNRVMPTVGSA